MKPHILKPLSISSTWGRSVELIVPGCRRTTQPVRPARASDRARTSRATRGCASWRDAPFHHVREAAPARVAVGAPRAAAKPAPLCAATPSTTRASPRAARARGSSSPEAGVATRRPRAVPTGHVVVRAFRERDVTWRSCRPRGPERTPPRGPTDRRGLSARAGWLGPSERIAKGRDRAARGRRATRAGGREASPGRTSSRQSRTRTPRIRSRSRTTAGARARAPPLCDLLGRGVVFSRKLVAFGEPALRGVPTDVRDRFGSVGESFASINFRSGDEKCLARTLIIAR